MTATPPETQQSIVLWLSRILPPDPNTDDHAVADAIVLEAFAKRPSTLPSRSEHVEPRRKRPRLLDSAHDHDIESSIYGLIPTPPATAVSRMEPTPASQTSGEKRALEEDGDNEGDSPNTTNANRGGQHITRDGETMPRADDHMHFQSEPLIFQAHISQDSTSAPNTVAPSVVSRAPSLPSRTSSPTKQMRYASLDITGYSIKSFSADAATMPASLTQVVLHLTDIQERVGIVPKYLKDELASYRVRDFSFYNPESVVRRWQFPTVTFVRKTMERAIQCAVSRELESSWNQDVHRPLLDWVFRPDSGHSAVDFRYCNAASIIPRFRPKTVPSKMVDYCIHVVPTTEERTRIDRLCTTRPAASINHTDWGNLSSDPIALSVETKRDGEGLEQALSQIGTWHAAQWRSLLLEKQQPPTDIDFLPAFIAQGHSWYFVATTRHDSGQAWLYTKMEVGTTETLIGTFQILAALQYFKCWIEDSYWPAFRRYMLALG
ncbi:hypothetical protein CABS01_16627 [Colletotrichum abscissum]|uniref:uncharacterized protein n=1 Tax=Colletotrichum abscissum TaxID=1671311 RepID=UPI0027D72A93|nr:uncharacterized protein CABS01_16627 [Colletotrichum abscissum]KAK1519068.1 hypothetical protein CABS01_16627 [Colletotrichum abscissum]